jgi:hypothetical protein
VSCHDSLVRRGESHCSWNMTLHQSIHLVFPSGSFLVGHHLRTDCGFWQTALSHPLRLMFGWRPWCVL